VRFEHRKKAQVELSITDLVSWMLLLLAGNSISLQKISVHISVGVCESTEFEQET
jgi:hypothetical protein